MKKKHLLIAETREVKSLFFGLHEPQEVQNFLIGKRPVSAVATMMLMEHVCFCWSHDQRSSNVTPICHTVFMVFTDIVNGKTTDAHSGITRVFFRVTPWKNRYKFVVDARHHEEGRKGE